MIIPDELTSLMLSAEAEITEIETKLKQIQEQQRFYIEILSIKLKAYSKLVSIAETGCEDCGGAVCPK